MSFDGMGGTRMWYDESVIYQIYPLGFCGAPYENDGFVTNRIRKVTEWIPYFREMNIGAVLFNPVFESERHGYDTRDYLRIDSRLGTNEDFKECCGRLHEAGIRVILDGVFNHAGRSFGPFQDVLRSRQDSPYRDWFHIRFDGSNSYNDNLWYEGWEGHESLVKLNLQHPDCRRYLLDAVASWIREFGIDGLRLDVAYMIDRGFLKELHNFCLSLKSDFFLLGEIIHGDYKQITNSEMMHSATNYECYKGLYSSFNSMNMFEIGHSLKRQFGSENWTLYRGMNLLSFADNHDVTRIASELKDTRELLPLYTILFGMPGIPCLYYGSEWGAEGLKRDGDQALRQSYDAPVRNELGSSVAALAAARKSSKALAYGDFNVLVLTNCQIIFERSFGNERILVAVNASDKPYTAHFNANAGRARDLISGEIHDFGGGSVLEPFSGVFWEPF